MADARSTSPTQAADGGVAGFAGKIAAVTGSASGMGLDVALLLARSGARVFGYDVAEMPEKAARLIEEGGGGALRLDVADEAAVRAAASDLKARSGGLDLLCNAAGAAPALAEIAATDAAVLTRLLQVDVVGAFLMMKHFSSLMRCGGSIVNWSSVAALKRGPGVFGAVKAAVIALTKSAAAEFGPSGVRVNAVCPGAIQTEAQARFASTLPDSVVQGMLGSIPLQRLGRVSEASKVVAFLLGEDSSYVTGVALPIDGGALLG